MIPSQNFNNPSTKVIENQYHTIKIENGVIIGTYHPDLRRITLPIAKKLIADRKKICNGKSYPVLGDTFNGSSLDDDARLFFASDEALQLISAFALLVHNPFTKLIGSFYLKVKPLKIPAKLFTNKAKAMKWLLLYRNLS